MDSKVFYDEDNVVKLVCPKCNFTKKYNISKFINKDKTTINCKCQCGHVYPVSFEKKNEVHEDIFLPGKYVFCDGRGQGDIIVTKLSDSGLSFEIGQDHKIKKNDIFFVEYRLDNSAQSLVNQEVLVKKVEGTSVDVEFY